MYNNMNQKEEKIEMFRISPEFDKYYEYAEYMFKEGSSYKNERYYVINMPQYVGKLVKRKEGGYHDNRWRVDYFQDNNGNEIAVNYSYEGKTCFREVECKST